MSTPIVVVEAEQHWRYAAQGVRFLMFDARSVISIVIFLVHMKAWTAGLAFATFILFWLLERTGMEVPDVLRLARLRIGGLWRGPIQISSGERYQWRLKHQ